MREMITRTLSGAVYAFILIASLLLDETVFFILFFVFGAILLYELQNLLKLESYVSYLVLILFLVLFSFLKIDGYFLYTLLALSIGVKLYLIKDLMTFDKIPLSEVKKYLVTVGYLIASVTFLTLLPYTNSEYCPELLIAIFSLVWVNDSFAYLVGKNFGRKKLFERISPNKTVEGFIGGLVFTMIGGFLAFEISGIFDALTWIIIGILASVFGTLGDLIQSKLKRQAGVKDSGKLMPGHGGLFDRLDSVLFAETFIYAFLLILY